MGPLKWERAPSIRSGYLARLSGKSNIFRMPLNPVNPDPDIRPSAKEITSRRQAKVLFLKKICGEVIKKDDSQI